MTSSTLERPKSKTKEPGRQEVWCSPPVDVYEDSREFVVFVELAGVDESGVSLQLDGERLTIEARRDIHAGSEYRQLYSEMPYTNFRRVLAIPEWIDRDQVSASIKNGVLLVRLPKAAKAEPKKLVIKTN